MQGETIEKRPLAPPAYIGGTLHSDFNPLNIQYIPVVKILMRLDLGQN